MTYDVELIRRFTSRGSITVEAETREKAFLRATEMISDGELKHEDPRMKWRSCTYDTQSFGTDYSDIWNR